MRKLSNTELNKSVAYKKRVFKNPQYTVLKIQFGFVKFRVGNRISKNFEQRFIPIQAIQGNHNVLI